MSRLLSRALCAGPRTLFGLGGSVVLLSVALATTVSPWFLLLAVFAGLNQLLYAAVGACPASLILRGACARDGGSR